MERFWRAVGWALAALIALSVAGQWLARAAGIPRGSPARTLVDLFYLDAEGNVPTWFSSSLMLVSAAILAAIGARRRAAGLPQANHWTVLGAGFVLMSIDEITQVHERIAKYLLPFDGGFGPAAFNFVYLGAVVTAAVGVAYVPFLRRLPPAARRGMLAAGALFVGGAVGVEVLGAWLLGTVGPADPRYVVVAHLEEGLELAGVYLFARTVWRVFEATPRTGR
jgi:hypothetical protein